MAVFSAISSLVTGNKQANAVKEGTRQANKVQQHMYDTSRQDLMPWMKGGERALGELNALYGLSGADLGNQAMERFETSPGYQFRLGEGVKAIDRSAAARGTLNSGATLKALNDYGQGMASQEFGTHVNRLSSLAGLGQTTAAQTGQFGQQTGASMANNHLQNAQGRASAYANINSGINQGIENSLFALGGSQGWFKQAARS